MHKTIAYFEIYGDDPSKLAGFYEGLFGWKIERAPGPNEYWRVHTVPTDAQGRPTAPGVNGGLMKRPSPEVRNWLNYVAVESVDDTVAQAQQAGGKVLKPKSPVPGAGWFAILFDPEKNVFALWQDDPNAG